MKVFGTKRGYCLILGRRDEMNYEELIQKRQSIRSFKEKSLKEEQLDEIREFFDGSDRLIDDIDVSLMLCAENAGIRLEGVVGYQGYAFNAPLYLVLLSEEKEGFYENIGFIAEALSLKLTDMELDQCWLTVDSSDMVKKVLNIDTDLTIAAVIACGYGNPELEVTRIDIITQSNVEFEKREGHVAPKIAASEMVFEGSFGKALVREEDQFDPYLDKALCAASFAPSFLNLQTYRYILRDHDIVICDRQDKMVSAEDRKLSQGATMYNFYITYSQYNNSGYKWKLGKVDNPEDLKLPKEYEAVASMRLW